MIVTQNYSESPSHPLGLFYFFAGFLRWCIVLWNYTPYCQTFMNRKLRSPIALGLLFVLYISVIPCGPSYVTPIYTVRKSPEFPYEEFAAGRLGLIKPTFHRSVLFAAYRWVNGGGLSGEEQRAMTEVWRAEFRHEPYIDDATGEAVKAWIEKRKSVADPEEELPVIYVEREYGGFSFFPNCTQNAFETAAETLADRAASHGNDDRYVREWVRGQDAVFTNCSSGKQLPAGLDPSWPQWLQKDRQYQLAAAAFYAMSYDEARERFAAIAIDHESPWRETADYLVARTLIRQASVASGDARSDKYYALADEHLQRFASTSGKYADSAQKLQALIKYRLTPRDRVQELARTLVYYGGPNFRQDVIDYTWLMDKFEKEGLEAEEKRRYVSEASDASYSSDPATRAAQAAANSIAMVANTYASNATVNAPSVNTTSENNPNTLLLRIFAEDYSASWNIEIPVDASDDEALSAAEAVVGYELSPEIQKRVRDTRRWAYSDRFGSQRKEDYQGGYHGSVERSISFLPEFLRSDDLTDWLFTYQIQNTEAYLHSLKRYRENGSDVWLMAAISKAERNSTGVPQLLDAAERFNRTSVAYPTIAYNAARIRLEMGQTSAAIKILDEALKYSSTMPISTVNELLEMRQVTVETLDDYLAFSLRKPFAFDLGGSVGTIDQLIADSKRYFDPRYNTEGREAYDREIEEQFRTERLWQDRVMMERRTVETMNLIFPQSVLQKIEASPRLPDYLRERFTIAVFTRSALLKDWTTMDKMMSSIARIRPEMTADLDAVRKAGSGAAREHAALYLLLRNPILTPFITDDMGKTDNEADAWDINDWWCEPYDEFYDESTREMVGVDQLKRPAFLTNAEVAAAARERTALTEIGNATSYLGRRTLEWAKTAPNDPRVPEALYLMWKANEWTKYGCGGDLEVRRDIEEHLKRHYAQSIWTQRLINESEDQN